MNPFTYTGREFDSESGLYFYRARYCDPRIGRFLQEDPFPGNLDEPQSINKYPYVSNNPVNFVDPEGLNPLLRYLPRAAGVLKQFAQKSWKWVKENVRFEGPGKPGTREQGRICQIRYKGQPLIRIDYWQYPGTGGEPRLHMHLDKIFPGKHIPLDPREWFK